MYTDKQGTFKPNPGFVLHAKAESKLDARQTLDPTTRLDLLNSSPPSPRRRRPPPPSTGHTSIHTPPRPHSTHTSRTHPLTGDDDPTVRLELLDSYLAAFIAPSTPAKSKIATQKFISKPRRVVEPFPATPEDVAPGAASHMVRRITREAVGA